MKLSLFGVKYNTFREGIEHYFSLHFPSINVLQITELLKNNYLTLLLDGLDEVKEENHEWCLDEIESLYKNFSDIKCIITGREDIYSFNSDKIVSLELLPLTEKQVESSLRDYGYNRYQVELDINLLRNPLLLKITLELIKTITYKMRKKIDFYNDYTNHMISKWDSLKGKKTENKVSNNQITKILSILAFKYFDEPTITDVMLESEISELLPLKNEQTIFSVINKTNLLVQDEFGSEFLHQTFKEYFAAIYMLDNMFLDKKCIIPEHILKSNKWRPVIIFLSGLIRNRSDKNAFFNKVFAIDLKLFVDCVENESINLVDYKTDTDEELAVNYLKTFLDTYRAIVIECFPELKYQFAPYESYHGDFDKSIGILWEHLPNKSIYYSLTKTIEPQLIRVGDFNRRDEIGMKQYENNVLRYSTSSARYDWEHKFYMTPRQTALKKVEDELSSILKEKRLIIDEIILSNSYLSKIRKLRIDVNESIENQVNEINNVFSDSKMSKFGLSGNDFKELSDEMILINKFKINPMDYDLPQPDKEYDGSSNWVWGNYSEEQMINRVKRFFELHLKSFKIITEANFSKLKHYFPDYQNSPVDIFVEISFPKDKKGVNLEPSLMFYSLASENYNTQRVNVEVVEGRPKREDGLFEQINDSFKRFGREASSLTITNTGFMMVLNGYGDRNKTVIEDYIYKKIEDNLKSIFAGFRVF